MFGVEQNAITVLEGPQFKDASTTKRMVSGGRAVFENLAVDKSGQCYSVLFSLGNLR